MDPSTPTRGAQGVQWMQMPLHRVHKAFSTYILLILFAFKFLDLASNCFTVHHIRCLAYMIVYMHLMVTFCLAGQEVQISSACPYLRSWLEGMCLGIRNVCVCVCVCVFGHQVWVPRWRIRVMLSSPNPHHKPRGLRPTTGAKATGGEAFTTLGAIPFQ